MNPPSDLITRFKIRVVYTWFVISLSGPFEYIYIIYLIPWSLLCSQEHTRAELDSVFAGQGYCSV